VITWIILRAAGIAAYLMLFASVAWGLVGTTSVVGKRVAKPTAIAIHQFIATVAVALLGVHIGGLLVDRFMPFGFLDVLIPMHGAFKPVATSFGIMAMYAAVVVLVSSWLRKPLGTKWWRRLHLLAVPAFGMSMVHGAFAGTDTVRPWMWWIYVVTGGVVVFLVLTRGLTAGIRAVRAAHPARARTARPSRPETQTSEPEAPARQAEVVRTTTTARPTPVRPVPTGAPAAGTTPLDPAREPVVKLEIHVVVDDAGKVRLAPLVVPATLAPTSSNGNGHRAESSQE
jgi:methionine sulfoxide reductase heme-binding subunit